MDLSCVVESGREQETPSSQSTPGGKGKTILTVNFSINDALTPEELLIYALLNIKFPNKPYKARKYSDYDDILKFVKFVTGKEFSSTSLFNYLVRTNNKAVKGLGMAKAEQRYRTRWSHYSATVKSMVTMVATQWHDYQNDISIEDKSISEKLDESISSLENPGVDEIINLSALGDECLVRKSNWTFTYDQCKDIAHFYYFPVYKNYAAVEIVVSKGDEQFSWDLLVEGVERKTEFVHWLKFGGCIETRRDVNSLLSDIEALNICRGVDWKPLHHIVGEKLVAYFDNHHNPAAFVETELSQFHRKIVRSAKCELFLHSSGITCSKCQASARYLATRKEVSDKSSKFTPFSVLSREELLEKARNLSQKYKQVNRKLHCLEKVKEKLQTVNSSTHKDLKHMFNKLYSNFARRRQKLSNNDCCWLKCDEKFDDCEALFSHVVSHVESQSDIVPIDRVYSCKWKNCEKSFGKKKLLENHLRQHTGETSDSFMEILLNDQCRALSMPSRQMRWHPLVIKWCLRMWNKSHTIYNDMRSSGMLKLPSGRTLNDYKNFNKPSSGWNSDNLNRMHELAKDLSGCDRTGGLFFDEVKIKEGLVFDPASFELVGFVDLGDDKDFELEFSSDVESSSEPLIWQLKFCNSSFEVCSLPLISHVPIFLLVV